MSTSRAEPTERREPPESDGAVRPRWLERIRSRAVRLPGGELAWQIGIGALGLVIIAVGALLLPLPGPGWLIIFLGLGVWSTEFSWAGRLLRWLRGMVGEWTAWAKRQPWWLQMILGVAGLVFLAAVAIGGYWLLH